MKAILFVLDEFGKNSHKAFFKEQMSEHHLRHSIVCQNTRVGSLISQCYGVKETPSLLVIRDDGSVAYEKKNITKSDIVKFVKQVIK